MPRSYYFLVVITVAGLALVISSAWLPWPQLLSVVIPVYLVQAFLVWKRERQQEKHVLLAQAWDDLGVCVSYLNKASQGANANSVWAILGDLLGNGEFQTQMKTAGTVQAGRLLERQCDMLFQRTGELERNYQSLRPSDRVISSFLSQLDKEVVFYRPVVGGFLKFLTTTGGGAEAVQDKVPFSTRIHRELADDYDRLMDSLRNVRESLLTQLPPRCLTDDKLSRFPHGALLG